MIGVKMEGIQCLLFLTLFICIHECRHAPQLSSDSSQDNNAEYSGYFEAFKDYLDQIKRDTEQTDIDDSQENAVPISHQHSRSISSRKATSITKKVAVPTVPSNNQNTELHENLHSELSQLDLKVAVAKLRQDLQHLLDVIPEVETGTVQHTSSVTTVTPANQPTTIGVQTTPKPFPGEYQGYIPASLINQKRSTADNENDARNERHSKHHKKSKKNNKKMIAKKTQEYFRLRKKLNKLESSLHHLVVGSDYKTPYHIQPSVNYNLPQGQLNLTHVNGSNYLGGNMSNPVSLQNQDRILQSVSQINENLLSGMEGIKKALKILSVSLRRSLRTIGDQTADNTNTERTDIKVNSDKIAQLQQGLEEKIDDLRYNITKLMTSQQELADSMTWSLETMMKMLSQMVNKVVIDDKVLESEVGTLVSPVNSRWNVVKSRPSSLKSHTRPVTLESSPVTTGVTFTTGSGPVKTGSSSVPTSPMPSQVPTGTTQVPTEVTVTTGSSSVKTGSSSVPTSPITTGMSQVPTGSSPVNTNKSTIMDKSTIQTTVLSQKHLMGQNNSGLLNPNILAKTVHHNITKLHEHTPSMHNNTTMLHNKTTLHNNILTLDNNKAQLNHNKPVFPKDFEELHNSVPTGHNHTTTSYHKTYKNHHLIPTLHKNISHAVQLNHTRVHDLDDIVKRFNEHSIVNKFKNPPESYFVNSNKRNPPNDDEDASTAQQHRLTRRKLYHYAKRASDIQRYSRLCENLCKQHHRGRHCQKRCMRSYIVLKQPFDFSQL